MASEDTDEVSTDTIHGEAEERPLFHEHEYVFACLKSIVAQRNAPYTAVRVTEDAPIAAIKLARGSVDGAGDQEDANELVARVCIIVRRASPCRGLLAHTDDRRSIYSSTSTKSKHTSWTHICESS